MVGATGSIGRHVVDVALEKGYTVRTLVRDPAKARQFSKQVQVIAGDVTRPKTLTAAVDGIDAVIFTLGSDGLGMTCDERARSCATAAAVSLSRFSSYSGMPLSRTERYLGCKQNLGHPVNDLFDLKTDVQPHEMNVESAAMNGSMPVEKASRQGIECRHGGSEDDQHVCDSRQLSLPERTDLVEVREGYRPHSLRRCSEAGASGGDSRNKADRQSDQRTRGSVGFGTLPDPTS
ncbi:MAG: hypothetical protein DMG76_31345 [Acidobacteria bacterium]|nr:MAG: hypothetical protein DMG76_31345 [Acidobacteriota bacterium]